MAWTVLCVPSSFEIMAVTVLCVPNSFESSPPKQGREMGPESGAHTQGILITHLS